MRYRVHLGELLNSFAFLGCIPKPRERALGSQLRLKKTRLEPYIRRVWISSLGWISRFGDQAEWAGWAVCSNHKTSISTAGEKSMNSIPSYCKINHLKSRQQAQKHCSSGPVPAAAKAADLTAAAVAAALGLMPGQPG